MRIGADMVGPGEPCFVIAEVGLQHDGSLSQAHAYIDACTGAGVDAVKFQCHLRDGVDGWREVSSYGSGETRGQYWERTGFGASEWIGLAEHCEENRVHFLCSPFSVEAVGMLEDLVPAWKIPSGQIKNTPMLQAIKATGKPVLASTGMATMAEIAEFRRHFPAVQFLQCTSKYPTEAEDVGLFEAAALGGLSDHSGTIWAGLGAVAMGINVLEVHVCWSRHEAGPDVDSALTIEDLRDLVKGCRYIERAKELVKKDEMAKELQDMRDLFMVTE